jgi:electron transfer flavoprotein beta subunit
MIASAAMHIAVCIKQIPDPEIAPSVFRVDEQARRVVPVPGLSPVISPFDEQAIEAALRVRDAASDPASVRITVLTLGDESVRAMVKHALALGADDAVLLIEGAFSGSDGYATALALARSIERMGDVDLVLAGRQAADGDAGVVGLGIAEILGIPAITFAREVRVADGVVTAVRALGDVLETMTAPLPALVTVAHELGTVRKASLRETMRAAKKPAESWTAQDIGLDGGRVGEAGSRRVLERLFQPVSRGACEFVAGQDPADTAAALVRRLVEEKIL